MSSTMDAPRYDVAILGGGPAGLAAALALGRACRRVVLFDAGSPRNATTPHIQNFLTRDGIPPADFRRIARAQLGLYSTVLLRDEPVTSIAGELDAFTVTSLSGALQARRVILCTGMVDEMLDITGFREAWGHSIFQCPYCHGWEVRGRRWGYLALDHERLVHGFPAMLTSWTDEVVVFVGADLQIPEEAREDLVRRGIAFEPRRVARLAVERQSLTHVELADGERIPCEVLFAHPPQRHVDVVQALGLDLDPRGYVRADPMTRQTSLPGMYAAGDLTTPAQGAVFAAATGTQAGAMCNHDLCSSTT